MIKIEPPHGEPGRRRADPGKSATLPFAMLNQNKHAVTLNLKEPRGRELLFRMVERADVLLENFSPGTMDGLGVGWSRLHEINPRLVYASGTGFGLSGPDRDNLAMDMTIQAASGIMSVTGFPDGPPVKAGPTLVDFMGGIHLYAGVLTALYDRDRSGLGPPRRGGDAGDGLFAASPRSFDYYYRTGEIPPRTGNRQSGMNSAPYNVFPTADGHVAIHVVTEAHFQNLLKAMGREDLADDPRFATNAGRVAHMDETDALVAEWTRTLGKMEVFARTKEYRIPCAPVRNRARGHERPAYARARHARAHRPPRIGRDRRAEDAVAPARRRQGRRRPEPDHRPAQRRDLRRLARPFGCRHRGAASGRGNLISCLEETAKMVRAADGSLR